MKYFALLILFFYGTLGFAENVAIVGSYQISDSELSSEMEQVQAGEDTSYSRVRLIALERLIKKYILLNYADENGITVDDVELEAFFMHQLGEMPRFQTNGVFDRSKYLTFSQTSNGRKILTEMRKEILVNKTRTLIENSIQISDNELLRNYFMETTEIDLGYAIINVEDANVPMNISMQAADRYYYFNRRKFDRENKVKLKFFLVFKDDFTKAVAPRIKSKLDEIVEADSTLGELEISNIKAALETEETTKMAIQKTKQLRELLMNDESVFYPVIESHYLSADESLGNLPTVIIKSAFEMKEGQFSQPIDFGEGVIVFQVIDFDEIERDSDLEIANAVWKEFLAEERDAQNDYREYFITHIDKFIVKAAIVNTIEISRSSLFITNTDEDFINEIRQKIEENIENPRALQQIAEQDNLESDRSIIFLDTFHNESPLQDGIASLINRNMEHGFIPAENGLVFFWVDSFFPEYIPDFSKVKDQLPKFVDIAQSDSTDYREYYNSHKKDFMTADSLQLGGVIFGIEDNISELQTKISDDELLQIYQENIDDYYRNKSVMLDYIFVEEKSLADIVFQQSKNDINFNLLKYCFDQKCRFPADKIIEYEKIPDRISKILGSASNETILKPIAYDNGWLIIKKLKGFRAGMIPFKDVKNSIRHEKLLHLSDTYAFNAAKTIFDSTSYFSHLQKYFQPEQIFKTRYQDTDLAYDHIGSIKEYRRDLMRIWRNEKYSSIIKNDIGYAVIFVLKKRSARKLTFEESQMQIEDILAANERFKNARSYISSLRDEIKNDVNPDSLLRFLGGWKKAEDMSLKSEIPGVNFSNDIMNDILDRETGYCSPVIPINENQLMFYYIERLKRPSEEKFMAKKATFKSRYLQKEYRLWLEKYRAKIDIQKKY